MAEKIVEFNKAGCIFDNYIIEDLLQLNNSGSLTNRVI